MNPPVKSFRKSKFADRGKDAEKLVNSFLLHWQSGSQYREFNRLTDAKAAGRLIGAAPADFEFFIHDYESQKVHGLIEVKETEHEYRLARDKVPQMPRLRKRSKCGGECLVVVYHSTLKAWRVMFVDVLADTGDKGSWNLSGQPASRTCAEALHEALPEVFPG